MTSEELWRYYGDAAKMLGASENKNGNTRWKRQNTTLVSFFRKDDDKEFDDPTEGRDPRSIGDKTLLLQAFLGHGDAMRRFKAECEQGKRNMPSEEDIRPYLCTAHNRMPYYDQRNAIRHAVSMPLTVIQGPPGTGKTETILNLLSVIHGLEMKKKSEDPDHKHATVAILSSVNEAIRNIDNEIFEGDSFAYLRKVYSKLGNKTNRHNWRKACINEGVYSDKNKDIDDGSIHIDNYYTVAPAAEYFEAYPPQDAFKNEYLEHRPMFSSTIHALRFCFGDGQHLLEKFDYIIVDECSQVNIVLGLVAMGCAEKHLILLGDNEQLGPIVIEDKFKDIPDFAHPGERDENFKKYDITGDNSFLSACEKVFGDTVESFMLTEHHRCVPEIIEFCNRFIYGSKLTVRTERKDGIIPFNVYWYEGDYSQYVTVENGERGLDAYYEDHCEENEAGARKPRKQVLLNERQMAVFLEEVLPELLLAPYNDPTTNILRHPSIGIISPYRKPIEKLNDMLKERLERMIAPNPDPVYWEKVTEKAGNDRNMLDTARSRAAAMLNSLNVETDDNNMAMLTVHKAQGKGFDIVCFLTIRDYYQYSNFGVWAQQRHLINVAVSRAKDQFYVITSSRWLPIEFLDKKNAWSWESKPLDDDRLYVWTLLDYIYGLATNTDTLSDMFHRSEITSVFDDVPRYRYENKLNGIPDNSAPEQCIYDVLKNRILNEQSSKYTVSREFPIKLLCDWGVIDIDKLDTEDIKYAMFASVDFLICRGKKILCGIEVDGSYHRVDEKQQDHDDMKNNIFETSEIGLVRINDNGSIYPEESAKEWTYIHSIIGRTSERMINELGGLISAYKDDSMKRISDEQLETIKSINESREKKIELMNDLKKFLSTALDEFKDLDPDERKAIASKLNYKGKENRDRIPYAEKTLDQLYFMRYGIAYALEYVMMYDIMLRDFINSTDGAETFRVCCFGCGGFLDAWSLAYAMAKLRAKGLKVPKAVYDGIDIEEWGYRLEKHFSLDGLTVNELVKKPMEEYLPTDGAERTVLIFPRILNEIDTTVVDSFINNLDNFKFGKNVYICALHGSVYDLEGDTRNGARAVKRIAEKIAGSSGHILDDLTSVFDAQKHDALNEKYREITGFDFNEFDAVRAEYLGGTGFDFVIHNEDTEHEKYYAIENEEDDERKLHFQEIDPHFRHDPIMNYLNKFNKEVNDSNIHIQQMLTPYTKFQVIKIVK